ncbi:transporter [Streptomyces mirabilis]|uniref:ABC transporter permease subunit n=1 Tax=Streptomyces mirabilis TaxID=68239 RepID=UPI001989968F|nr:ABC transporter permease subunit [Streptomyces mirabilis]GHD57848.1 transporter [Streptomyces mirabilis]
MSAAVNGLPWTVLRLHRAALLGWGSFVAAVTGLLLWMVEVKADAARDELAYCSHHDMCSITAALDYDDSIGLVAIFLCYSFLAVAAWAGAALVARELETGTAQLAWTQSVTPVRWLVAKLAQPALLITVGGAVLVPAFRHAWWINPDRTRSSWTSVNIFVALGPPMVAYSLCALAVGALAGLVLRRSLPALGVSFAVMLMLHQLVQSCRTDLWPSVTRTGTALFNPPDTAWQLANGVIVHGKRVANPEYGHCNGTGAEAKQCLADHGITGYYSVYHPDSHFWPLQLVETGIVLAVTAAATAAAFRLLRRRTA